MGCATGEEAYTRAIVAREAMRPEWSVSVLGVEQLTFRAEPNSWSTLDVLEHLVKVEEGIAERVRVSPSTVRYWRERNGITRPRRDAESRRRPSVRVGLRW